MSMRMDILEIYRPCQLTVLVDEHAYGYPWHLQTLSIHCAGWWACVWISLTSTNPVNSLCWLMSMRMDILDIYRHCQLTVLVDEHAYGHPWHLQTLSTHCAGWWACVWISLTCKTCRGSTGHSPRRLRWRSELPSSPWRQRQSASRRLYGGYGSGWATPWIWPDDGKGKQMMKNNV